MQYLRQSTSVSVVIGPVWATADGALKADLAYNASGINCDIYKNGTKADITLANSAGDGYFRAGSGEALYLLTLSTGHTDAIGRAEISLSATGYYCKPREFVVLDEAVYDVLFGTTAPSTLAAGALMGLANDAITAAKFDESTAFPLGSATGSTLTAIPWNAAWDAEVQSECADAITAYGFADDTDVAAAVRDVTLAGAASGGLGAAVADVLTDTGTTLDALIKDVPTAAQNADALLGRSIAGGSSAGRMVKDALRILRNRSKTDAGTLTVYAEDDTTPAWTAAVTEDAAANPITEIDPA